MKEILYKRPSVRLLQETGLGTAEIASRTCYNSIDKSEHQEIINFEDNNEYNDIESSELLDKLAWTHFHHSVLEHSVLTYHLQDVSRGVLQELSRHRIASPSVKSTRYTLSNILFAFAICSEGANAQWNKKRFNDYIKDFKVLNLLDDGLHKIETDGIYDKLFYHKKSSNIDKFLKSFMSKENYEYFCDGGREIEIMLSLKQKRNAGDKFKYIITDNFVTEIIWTINLRSLKNFLELRNSGSAWFQIRWLAEEIIEVTPKKYLALIMKEFKGCIDG